MHYRGWRTCSEDNMPSQRDETPKRMRLSPRQRTGRRGQTSRSKPCKPPMPCKPGPPRLANSPCPPPTHPHRSTGMKAFPPLAHAGISRLHTLSGRYRDSTADDRGTCPSFVLAGCPEAGITGSPPLKRQPLLASILLQPICIYI